MTKHELTAKMALCGTRTSHHIREALADIYIRGKTWREAAQRNRVTESGILRAIRRIGLR